MNSENESLEDLREEKYDLVNPSDEEYKALQRWMYRCIGCCEFQHAVGYGTLEPNGLTMDLIDAAQNTLESLAAEHDACVVRLDVYKARLGYIANFLIRDIRQSLDA